MISIYFNLFPIPLIVKLCHNDARWSYGCELSPPFVQVPNTLSCTITPISPTEMFVVACGTVPPDVKPTVVGGVRPNVTEFPWHATLYRDEAGVSKKFFCGASIIQENLLITAAHCVYDETTRQLIDPSKIHVLTGNLFRDYNYTFHNRNLVKKNQV